MKIIKFIHKTKFKFYLTSYLKESIGINFYWTAMDSSLPTFKPLGFQASELPFFCNSVTNNKVTPNRNATIFFQKVFEQFTG